MGLNFGSNMFERNINEALTDRSALAGDWTRIVEEGTLITIQTSSAITMYTVPAGKFFYLISWALRTASGISANMNVRNASDTVVYELYNIGIARTISQSFPIPLRIPAGFYIQSEGMSDSGACFQGYEVDE